MSLERAGENALLSPPTKPHQADGGGYGITLLLNSSRGTPFRPGASVGRGEIAYAASIPTGVSIAPSHGTATTASSSTKALVSANVVNWFAIFG